MIQTKEIQLNEEATIYFQTFYRQNINLPAPHQIPTRSLTKSPSNNSLSSKTICYRCGQVGHLASQCPNELPNPSEIESEMNKEISNLIQQLKETGNYDSDEFGLFSKENTKPVNSGGKNWSNSTFCPNCGRAHSHNKCPHINYNDLYNDMRNYFDNRSSYTSEQIRKLFYDIWES